MKICGISDLHGNLIENIPECDVLCICGDMVALNVQRNMEQSEHWWKTKFSNWVKKLKCDKVFVVPGNHDFYLENIYIDKSKYEIFKKDMLDATNKKVTFLIDETAYYKGISFYGTPWINPIVYGTKGWAFEGNENYKFIPKCDILLSHESPICNDELDYHSFGKSRYHLYGHWHDGRNDIAKGRYNCSRLTDCYNFKKKYEFIVLEIMTEIEKNKVEQDFLNKLIKEAELTQPNIAEWLSAYKNTVILQDIEDSVEWDTSADVLDSAVISDVED